MSTTTDLKAITLTANAKSVGFAKGADPVALQAQVIIRAHELRVLLTQLISMHPSGGGDAANLTSLNTILTALA